MAGFRKSQAERSLSHAQVFVPAVAPKSLQAINIAMNRNKWEPFNSPILPVYSPEWTKALWSVDQR